MTRPRPDEGWGSLSEDELRQELSSRGVSEAGSSEELVARLDELDAAAGAAAEEGSRSEPAQEDVAEVGAERASEAEERAAGTAAAADDTEDAGADTPAAATQAGGDAPDEPAAEASAPGPDEPAGRSEPGRRRGSVETSTLAARKPAPRRADGAFVVRARAKYVRSAPRKARLVMEHIRGRPVEQARAILVHAPRSVSADVLKLLNSAVANAESNYELAADELRVRRAFVDEGPTIKRYRPRALGRATRIHRRTSHMTIELTTPEDGRR